LSPEELVAFLVSSTNERGPKNPIGRPGALSKTGRQLGWGHNAIDRYAHKPGTISLQRLSDWCDLEGVEICVRLRDPSE
jgi:hypothetical protein